MSLKISDDKFSDSDTKENENSSFNNIEKENKLKIEDIQ